jgi:hypothetical protein
LGINADVVEVGETWEISGKVLAIVREEWSVRTCGG